MYYVSRFKYRIMYWITYHGDLFSCLHFIYPGMSSPGTSSSFASSGIFPGSDKSSPYPSIPGSSSPSPPSLVTSGQISCSAPGGLVFTPSSSNIDEGIDLDSSDQLLDYYEDSKPKRKRVCIAILT